MRTSFLLLVGSVAWALNAGRSVEPVEASRSLATRFVEIPGERLLSGRLIVRSKQLRDLEASGLTRAQAFARRDEARRALAAYEILSRVPQTDEVLLRVPAGSSEEAVAEALMHDGGFEYAEPDWLLSPLDAGGTQISSTRLPPGQRASPRPRPLPLCPDDSLFPQQWHHAADRMDSCAAWGFTTGTPSVSIGLCDTGVRTTHQDLQLHRLEGYNAVDRLWESEGGVITPMHFHGTRTTGVVAANGNNGLGVVGVGWNLSHRMLRVSSFSDGSAYLSDLQHGARTSIESGDRIANVSYHGATSLSNGPTATYIKSLGGLLLWGAGNTSSNYSHADRDADDLIVVGATDQNDVLASFSSYGTFVDLVAPGVAITTTDYSGDAAYVSPEGTSYACPLTAGVCAMIWTWRPTLSPDDVERVLKLGAEDLGAPGLDSLYGYGRINLYDSLALDGSAAPTAKLAALPASGTSPLPVAFRDLSGGVPTAWSWDFGDGALSDEQNPAHTYSAAGAYTVSLTVTNALGTDQTVVADAVLVDIIPPVADFEASVTGGLSPLTVDFTDLSSGGYPTTWLWDFGDGGTSTLENPSHVYTDSGFHTVSLTVSNAYGSDVLTRTSYVAVDFIAPVAAFSADPTTGSSPYVVQFTDESGGGVATTWQWYFGDGFGSTQQHPVHTYTAQGSYTVSLTAGNAYGSDLLVRSGYIDVGPGGPLLANFTGTPLSGPAPLAVDFTDLSVGNIVNWDWDFGDGGSSSEQNPTHVFTSPGEYDISLQVDNADGADDQLEVQKYVVVE